MKEIAILGSTGSIGTQACEVAGRLNESIRLRAISAHQNGELLLEQAVRFKPRVACLSDPRAAARFKGRFDEEGLTLLSGSDGLAELVAGSRYDLVLNALVGSAGLGPTLQVLERGMTLALANKESLVAGGRLVMQASRAGAAQIIPVDSEHSAIFQCLRGEDSSALRRIILTCSGGPFRSEPGDLAAVTVSDTLAHPTWSMGRKVTVDSATLMNKGLEILEAHHLFGLPLERIDVVVHPESVIHSMVEMRDGSVLAQMGVPDMRVPIQYALTFPERGPAPGRFLDLVEYGRLTFEEVDTTRFPLLGLAYRAGREGGTYPAAMNAANEVAVEAFLGERILFTGVAAVVERVLEDHVLLPGDSLDEVVEAETSARESARDAIGAMEVGGG